MESHTRKKSSAELKLLATEAASTLAALAKRGGGNMTANDSYSDIASANATRTGIFSGISADASEADVDGRSFTSGTSCAAASGTETETETCISPRDDYDRNSSTMKETIGSKRLTSASKMGDKQAAVEQQDQSPYSSMAQMIKETVLRRLRKPENIVKRNMFAVEGKSIKFPVKLMFILDECKQFQHIVSWSDNGQAFIIHNSRDFEDKVLPVIFKEARFSSFLRKLTRWGFLKKSTPSQGMKFYQRKFRRGNYSLCIDITCSNKASDIRRAQKRERENTPTSPTILSKEINFLTDTFSPIGSITTSGGGSSQTTSRRNSIIEKNNGQMNGVSSSSRLQDVLPSITDRTVLTQLLNARLREDEMGQLQALQRTNSTMLSQTSSITSNLLDDIRRNNTLDQQYQLQQQVLQEEEQRHLCELLSTRSKTSLSEPSVNNLNKVHNNMIRLQHDQVQQKLVEELLGNSVGGGRRGRRDRGDCSVHQDASSSSTLLSFSNRNNNLDTTSQIPRVLNNNSLASLSTEALTSRMLNQPDHQQDTLLTLNSLPLNGNNLGSEITRAQLSNERRASLSDAALSSRDRRASLSDALSSRDRRASLSDGLSSRDRRANLSDALSSHDKAQDGATMQYSQVMSAALDRLLLSFHPSSNTPAPSFSLSDTSSRRVNGDIYNFLQQHRQEKEEQRQRQEQEQLQRLTRDILNSTSSCNDTLSYHDPVYNADAMLMERIKKTIGTIESDMSRSNDLVGRSRIDRLLDLSQHNTVTTPTNDLKILLEMTTRNGTTRG